MYAAINTRRRSTIPLADVATKNSTIACDSLVCINHLNLPPLYTVAQYEGRANKKNLLIS